MWYSAVVPCPKIQRHGGNHVETETVHTFADSVRIAAGLFSRCSLMYSPFPYSLMCHREFDVCSFHYDIDTIFYGRGGGDSGYQHAEIDSWCSRLCVRSCKTTADRAQSILPAL